MLDFGSGAYRLRKEAFLSKIKGVDLDGNALVRRVNINVYVVDNLVVQVHFGLVNAKVQTQEAIASGMTKNGDEIVKVIVTIYTNKKRQIMNIRGLKEGIGLRVNNITVMNCRHLA